MTHIAETPSDFWTSRQGQTIEPSSFDALIELLLRNGSSSFIYRGQTEFSWGLECSLSRALRNQAIAGGPIPLDLYDSNVYDKSKNEHSRRMELRTEECFVDMAHRLRIPDLPALEDRLAWWEIMQHYGAPTRLLDWTRSPFVGMWFTNWNAATPDNDAALFVYNRDLSSKTYHRQIRAIDSSREWTVIEPRDWINQLAASVILTGGVVPLWITPHHGIRRIAAQQSVLTLIPDVTLMSGLQEYALMKLTTRIRIRSSWRSQISRATESLGMTQLSLFQDLDSLGSAVTYTLCNDLPRPTP